MEHGSETIGQKFISDHLPKFADKLFYPDKIIISYSFTSKNIGLLTLIKEL